MLVLDVNIMHDCKIFPINFLGDHGLFCLSRIFWTCWGLSKHPPFLATIASGSGKLMLMNNIVVSYQLSQFFPCPFSISVDILFTAPCGWERKPTIFPFTHTHKSSHILWHWLVDIFLSSWSVEIILKCANTALSSCFVNLSSVYFLKC